MNGQFVNREEKLGICVYSNTIKRQEIVKNMKRNAEQTLDRYISLKSFPEIKEIVQEIKKYESDFPEAKTDLNKDLSIAKENG